MLAYAASRPALVDRRPHPNAMLLIVGAHVAALAFVMSAKMEIPIHLPGGSIIVEPIPRPKPPKPNRPQHPSKPQAGPTVTPHPLPMPPSRGPAFPTEPTFHPLQPDPVPIPIPQPMPTPRPIGVTAGPQLLTPASDLKPPYPQSKIDSGEEAMLTLRLKIDANGRVVAVDPVGHADSVFLEAARRYLVAHWRYKPATEDGRAVDSSTVITLHFQLDT